MVRQDIVVTYLKQLSRKYLFNQPHMLSEDLYVSNYRFLTLEEYATARAFVCKEEQPIPCSQCPPLLQIAATVISDGYCKLSEVFRKVFPSTPYKTDVARRKALQMPLVCIRLHDEKLKGLWYLFEHKKGSDYQQFASFARVVVQNNKKTNKPP